jgi:hypothetical protein
MQVPRQAMGTTDRRSHKLTAGKEKKLCSVGRACSIITIHVLSIILMAILGLLPDHQTARASERSTEAAARDNTTDPNHSIHRFLVFRRQSILFLSSSEIFKSGCIRPLGRLCVQHQIHKQSEESSTP